MAVGKVTYCFACERSCREKGNEWIYMRCAIILCEPSCPTEFVGNGGNVPHCHSAQLSTMSVPIPCRQTGKRCADQMELFINSFLHYKYERKIVQVSSF